MLYLKLGSPHACRPLNSIGMPYYSEELLSSWTPRFHPPSYCLVAPPPPKIPPQVLSSIKFNDNVGYATLPKELKGRRNVVIAQAKRTQGRFRSDRSVHDTVSQVHIQLSSTHRSRSRRNPKRLYTSTSRTLSQECIAR